MKWIKPHEGGKFPATEKKYILRSEENKGFGLFVTPHAIDRDLWLREKWEWLDESAASEDFLKLQGVVLELFNSKTILPYTSKHHDLLADAAGIEWNVKTDPQGWEVKHGTNN